VPAFEAEIALYTNYTAQAPIQYMNQALLCAQALQPATDDEIEVGAAAPAARAEIAADDRRAAANHRQRVGGAQRARLPEHRVPGAPRPPPRVAATDAAQAVAYLNTIVRAPVSGTLKYVPPLSAPTLFAEAQQTEDALNAALAAYTTLIKSIYALDAAGAAPSRAGEPDPALARRDLPGKPAPKELGSVRAGGPGDQHPPGSRAAGTRTALSGAPQGRRDSALDSIVRSADIIGNQQTSLDSACAFPTGWRAATQ
jgi:hypothetical protein